MDGQVTTEGFQGSAAAPDNCSCGHIFIHLSKPAACIGSDPSYKLWIQVIIMCPCRVINCDPRTTPVGSVDGSIVGCGVSLFLFEPKTLTKKKSISLRKRKNFPWDFPGGPAAETPSSQRRGLGFNPCSGSQIPHAAAQSSHTANKTLHAETKTHPGKPDK